MKADTTQNENNTDNRSKGDDGQSNGRKRLVISRDLIGPLSLLVVIVGAVAAYYAYFYVSRDSARMQFWVGFMFSFIALVVVTVQIVIYAQQAEFMREQANMMAESNKLATSALYVSERPYVVVYGVQVTNLPFDPEKLIAYEVTVENRGKTPAYDVEFRMYIDVEPQLLPQEPSYRRVRTEERSSRVSLGMNIPAKAPQTDINDILSQDQVTAIKDSKLFVYIWGIVRYRDGLTDKIHHTKFYSVYSPEDERFLRGGHHNDMT